MKEKNIALITDSACDVSDEILKKYDIKMIPLRIGFSNRTYRDRVELSSERIYDMIEKELPKSSLPSSDDIENIFNEIKKEGYTDVLYVGISSGLSGTYNFVKMLGEEHNEFKMHAFDTKTLSLGQGMMVIEAARAIEKNKSVEEILKMLQTIRDKMSAFFVVKNLTYLSRGGRIGKVAGTVGSLLHLSPVISVNPDGVYETAAKTIGFQRAVDLMVKEIEKRFKGSKIALSVVHAMNEDEAKILLNKIKGFSDVVESTLTSVTAVLGVHTGPGLLGAIAYKV